MDAKELTAARQQAADHYDEQWPLRTTMGNLAREGFIAGWDAAMLYVKQAQDELALMQSDGRYCRHHDDDPAHSAICYQQGL